MTKTYLELIKLQTYDERLQYLRTYQNVGENTSSSYRYYAQKFYQSDIWKRVRRDVILRDNGCDLGLSELPLENNIFVHHINILSETDFKNFTNNLTDPNNLITVSKATHDSIHYSIKQDIYEERNFDIPWKGGP